MSSSVKFLSLSVLLFVSAPANPQDPKSSEKSLSVEKVEPSRAGLGDTISVTIKNWSKDKAVPAGWVLYLDGVPLKGVHPDNADIRDGVLRFYLRRDDVSKDAWATLLRQRQSAREVAVAVGTETEVDKTVAPLSKGFILTSVPGNWYYGIVVAALAIVLGFLGWKTALLRDRDTAAANKPLSLGRTQMAFWSVIILVSYLYLWWVTSDFLHTLTASALTLMGISAVTGLSAVLIDSDKQRQVAALQAEQTALTNRIAALQPAVTAAAAAVTANAAAAPNFTLLNDQLQQEEIRKKDVDSQLQQKAPTVAPAAENPFRDLLCEVNGLSLHRVQIFAWTLVLGFVFVIKVGQDLVMPEFDGTLLTLMGISSGTYLGFKFPEKKA
jgi:hypothetical protein